MVTMIFLSGNISMSISIIKQQYQYNYSNNYKKYHNKHFSLQFEEILKIASDVL